MSRPPKPVNPEKRPIDRPEHIRKVTNLLPRRHTAVTAFRLASAAATTEANVNVVTLIGNLATEVQLREVGPDKKVASFVLAVDRASREGGADFVTVSAWDRQAELCAEYLGRGRRIAVDGRLKSRSWEEEGKRRNAIEVVARRVEFLGGGPRRDEEEEGDGADIIPFEAPAAAG
jgi:single-strand DNA-binding protein